MQHDLPIVRLVAMLEQIDALPRAERQPPLGDGDGDRHRRQRGLDVRRHVVRPFGRMDDPAHRGIVRRRHEATEERVEVAPHVRVGILLDQQGA